MITKIEQPNSSILPEKIHTQMTDTIVNDIHERAQIVSRFPTPENAIKMLGEQIAKSMDYSVISESVSARLETSIAKWSKEGLTHSEAAKYLGISNDTLTQWVQDGRIAYSKIGGKNSHFLLANILQVIKDNSRKNPLKMTDRQRIHEMMCA